MEGIVINLNNQIIEFKVPNEFHCTETYIWLIEDYKNSLYFQGN